jgi:hypothetical protein
MIPFARTVAERKERNDPRRSLEERYATHEGYVTAVSKAAVRAVADGFLLPEDAYALIDAALGSYVLR